MYRKDDPRQPYFFDLSQPLGDQINPNNRWVQYAQLIPWKELEPMYEKALTGSPMGAPALSFRIALGALLIKEACGLSDVETVQMIRENPYMQYLLGYDTFQDRPLFHPTMMVHFRTRLEGLDLKAINESILERAEKSSPSDKSSQGEGTPLGTLKVDASCVPSGHTLSDGFRYAG